MGKKFFFMFSVLLLITLLFSGFVNAQLKVEITPVKDILLPIDKEKAIFLFDITNDASSPDSFSFIPSDLNWEWNNQGFDIPAKDKRTVQVELTPPKNLKAGVYTINLKVYSLINPAVKDINPVVIELVDVNKVIESNFIYNPDGLIPGRQNILKLEVKNRLKLPIDNLKIKVSSSILNYEDTIDLSENGKKTLEFYPEIKTGTIKDAYDVTITGTLNNKVISTEIEKISVGSIKDVQELKRDESGFLSRSVVLTRINNGNDVSQEIYQYKLGSFRKLFSKVNPAPTFVDKRNNIYTYNWHFSLKPGESYTVNVETNYTNFVLIILFIVIIALLAIYFIGALTVSKKVLSVKRDNNIVEAKVLINIRNRTRDKVKDLRVVDRLPRIMDAPYSYGTLNPSSIKRDEHGITLIWNINDIRPKEERVISYRTKPNKAVHGSLTFPSTILRYKTKKHKLITTSSGSVTVSSKK